ncbi:unnamed protein product [Clonostachys rosea]|uniref:NADAR domain-containing protein n=1 Tax=Bionectria ochroleuca TaxID=29856 RepID=A0ABY6TW25_BIOOC|nr:unnamed protein product [Clonostachys rosea]
MPKRKRAATPEEPSDSDGPIFWFGVDHKYGAFSQFFPATFTVPKADILRVVGQEALSSSVEQKGELVTFNRAEQFMMYSKAICFHDPKSAALILRSQSPKEQKSLGRKVENFTDQKWNAVKRQVVELGSTAKFGQNEDLRAMLLGTGDRELVEAAPRDRVWGIGFGEKRARTMTNREKWGQNLLGKALIKARENLRRGEEDLENKTEQA